MYFTPPYTLATIISKNIPLWYKAVNSVRYTPSSQLVKAFILKENA